MAARRIKGNWWVDLSWNGKRVRLKSPHDSRSGARDYEALLRREIALRGSLDHLLGPEAEAARLTFEEFAPRWMRDFVIPKNKPSGQQNKRTSLNQYLLPAFGKLRLAEITTLKIDQFTARIAASGKIKPKTLNLHLSVLRTALGTAQEWGLLDRIPRVRMLPAKHPMFRFLSREETERLLAATPAGLWRAMVLTAVRTGLRYGELSGLRWEDINLAQRTLTVQHNRVRGVVYSPKSDKDRHVPLTHDVLDALRCLAPNDAEVFHREGVPIEWASANRMMKQACKRANLRSMGWHVLRHTFASNLALIGIPLQVIRDLLGHSTVLMTEKYAHLAQNPLRDAIDQFEAHLGTTSGTPRHLMGTNPSAPLFSGHEVPCSVPVFLPQ